MANVIKRVLSALNPWYNWGTINVERFDVCGTPNSAEGDVAFFDLQWFRLHLGVQIGRLPPKPTPDELSQRRKHEQDRQERLSARQDRRERWATALAAYTGARARFDATPLNDDPQEVALLDAWCDALDHLIENVPAPDGEALAIKLGLIGDRMFREEWIPALAADARRLDIGGR